MHRTTTAGLVLLALLAASGGCLDLATGGTTSFEASQASVSDAALDETDYELANATTDNVSRTFEVAGQERDVRVTNHVTTYERTVSMGPLGEGNLARFVAFSTPAVEIAGQTFNPVGEWSERRIVTELSSQYSGLDGVSHAGNRTVTALDGERTVEEFTGRATVAGGQEVDVVLHVTKFRHGEDFVVAVGIYPERLSGEQAKTDALIGGLDHYDDCPVTSVVTVPIRPCTDD